MKQLMLGKVSEYYGDSCDFKILNKSMLPDPWFKNMLFASTDSLPDELTETDKKKDLSRPLLLIHAQPHQVPQPPVPPPPMYNVRKES